MFRTRQYAPRDLEGARALGAFGFDQQPATEESVNVGILHKRRSNRNASQCRRRSPCVV
jgi:hypothetical protein